MTEQRQTLGRKGEELALFHLQGLGYKILAKNYRVRVGEVDIIAEDAGTLVFVEVKTRNINKFGEPFESVTHHKQRQLSKAALDYISKHELQEKPARFDVVGIMFDGGGHSEPGEVKIELLKNAFDLCYGV